jgi:dipeptidyl aminopeptidase/acylaminoacyl peptidase
MKRLAVTLLCLLAVAAPAAAQQQKRPIQIDDLFRFKRVADPQISPDGKHVVYQVGTVNLEQNKITTNLWLAATDGKTPPRQLTSSTRADRHPRWSPDGKRILFESTRSGDSQLWVLDMSGGEARQLTTLSTGASNGTWAPDGKKIAFVSAVWPEYSDKPFKESNALNRKRAEERAKSPVKARVFKRLFYRHWDDWVEDKRQHLFVMSFADGKAGEPRDVTPGDHDAYPTSTTFSSSVDFTFSPDGTHLLFTAPPKKDEAWSTNYDIWRVAVDGNAKPENLTKDNKAADSGPQFSPDGTKLAYRAQKRAGFEADRWDILVVDVNPDGAFKGEGKSVLSGMDVSADEILWATVWNRGFVGMGLVFAAESKGKRPLYGIARNGNAFGDIFSVTLGREGTCGSLSASADGKRFTFTLAKLSAPAEVYTDTLAEGNRGEAPSLSQANDTLLAELDLPQPESVTVKGAGGTPMQMWILKPPGFDPNKKWPVVYLVHGGPQGAWMDSWSYRWNPQVWAAWGYVVALPNPRGSTGFGQKYVDEISGDWGGKCYEDLMKGVDYLESLPYVDKDRIASAGASFGGYMMNWFAVNTGRFKTLITHCSVWNFESMYPTTDELWFDEWEHGGPPWGKGRHSYEKFSPHRLAGNLGKFKTPMLVIHNDLDFRCPVGQGLELFGSLQRQRVPSRMVNFPDEGHWVLKPRNSQYWHQEVRRWLTRFVPPGGK